MRNETAFVAAALALLLSSRAIAEELVPPEALVEFGRTYKLAFTKKGSDGRALYEYTSDSESVENWTSLVTLNYTKANLDAMKWSAALKIALDAERPKPHYQLYMKGQNGYARIIYEPDANNPAYESNVHKSFHLASCGTVVFQYAVKYTKPADPAVLRSIAEDSAVQAKVIEGSKWAPACQ